MAAYTSEQGRRDDKRTRASVGARLERLRDVYELGDMSRAEYLRRRDELVRQRDALTAAPEPATVRQRTLLRTLVDDWDHLTLDERKRFVGLVFEEIVADADGLRELLPHEEWKTYMRSALPAPRVPF